MGACSKDLRLGPLTALDRGMPEKEAAGTFGDSPAEIKRRLKPPGRLPMPNCAPEARVP